MLLTILFILALFMPPAASATPIRVVLAVPPGQVLTDADRIQAQQMVDHALAFWTRYHPQHPTFAVTFADAEAVPQPGDENWLNPIRGLPDNGVTIWLYINTDPFYLFPLGNGSTTRGMALNHDALVLLEQRHLPWSEEAVAVHELGHILYHLPDRYYADGSCDAPDVMCNADAAYVTGWLGCQTLAALGGGCKPIYLPMVGHEPDSPCLRLYHPNAARRSVSPCVASTRRPATTQGTGGSIPQ